MVRFEVEDTGIGISQDKLDTLFNAFTQVDSSISRQYGGTGLGLTIVRRLAELMGGKVGVESALGTGSRFWFHIPARATNYRSATDTIVNAALAHDQSKATYSGRLMVAEDHQDNRKLLKVVLGSVGLEPMMVTNGQEALDAVMHCAPFDLILMDMRMPVMDGIEATRLIREWEHEHNRRRCSIIALTANAYEEDRRQCKDAGMDGFLAKPLDIKELGSLLSTLLQQHEAPGREIFELLPVDVSDLRERIEKLFPLLQNRMFDALKDFDDLKRSLVNTSLMADAESLGKRLEFLDFDTALQLLKVMSDRLDATGK